VLKQSNGLFNNYADGTTSNNFNDASSSALLAATVYHLALLTGNKKFIPEAERTRSALFSTNDTAAEATFSPAASATSSLANTAAQPSSSASASSAFTDTPHFTSDGWLTPVVNPLDIGVEGSQSPEGEAFALMLHAAWRDWSEAGSPGAASSARPSFHASPWGICGGGGGVPVLAAVGLVVACTFGDLFV
jgi:hypothetical protein